MKISIILAVLFSNALAQNNASSPNGCNDGLSPGRDEVIFTVPYTYAQVMSIIGDYKNITWSGSPYDTVTLNGTDNTVGTARTYDIDGAHVVETITTYSKPENGPYEEIHTLGLLTIPSLNLIVFGDYDGTTVTPTCNGAASIFNFTIDFCASNATLAAATLHTIHLTDAMTVGVFLGGQNFTTCAALANGTATSNTSMPSVVPASSATCNIVSMSTLISLIGGLSAWLIL